jgi:hypothetical protein
MADNPTPTAVNTKQNVVNMAHANRVIQRIYSSAYFNQAGSGKCIGNPDIRCNRSVRIIGVGQTFSGDYVVRQCTHRITAEGYTTTFFASTNSMAEDSDNPPPGDGGGGDGQQNGNPPSPPMQVKSPPPPPIFPRGTFGLGEDQSGNMGSGGSDR